MRKPVFPLVIRHLLGFLVPRTSSVSGNPPDVEVTSTIRIDINPLTVGRIIGAVIQTLSGSQLLLFSAVHRDPICIELAIALSDIGEPFSVGRPAVIVTGHLLRDQPSVRPIGVRYVHLRARSVVTCGKRDQPAVRRDAMVVITSANAA